MKKFWSTLLLLAIVIACNTETKNGSGTLGLISTGDDYEAEAVSDEPIEEEAFRNEGDVAFADNYNFAATSSTTAGFVSNGSAVPQESSSVKTPVPDNRKIIWNGTLRFQVSNTDSVTRNINQLVSDMGGFVSNMNMQSSGDRLSNVIQVRIASDRFHELIDELKRESIKLDKVDITSHDVTEEYVDIQNRLITKKQARERYIDILRNKTGDIKDVIEAEEAIRRITEEIEAKEGRLRYLKSRVDLCTVTISIYEDIEQVEPTVKKNTYGDRFMASFDSGWRFILGFSLFLTTIWPLLLIGLGLVVWKRKWLRTNLKRKA